MSTLEKRNFNFDRIVGKASEFTYSVEFNDDEPALTAVSEEFPEITGISPDAVFGKDHWEEFIHPDDVDRLHSHLKKVKSGTKSTCEYRLYTKDDSYITVLDYGKPELNDQSEQVKAVRCAVSIDQAYEKMSKA